jgi:hypothetical protein
VIRGIDMHISDIPPVIDLAALTIMPGVVFWRGDRAQQVMAAALYAVTVNSSYRVFPALLGVFDDLFVLMVALACTILASQGYWPIWTAAALLVSIAADLIHLANPSVGLWAYVSTDMVFWMVANAAVFCGALAHRPGMPATVRPNFYRPDFAGAAAPWAG